ncbi:MAG TPA: hypothetical protein GX709_01420 [Clostridiales bacterium]|nr:hypothetical protein [Clostridiales bacterium]
MKKAVKISIIVIGVIVIAVTSALAVAASQPSKIPEPAKIWEDMPENTNPNFKWLGYWGSL